MTAEDRGADCRLGPTTGLKVAGTTTGVTEWV